METATQDFDPVAPGNRIGGFSTFPVRPTWSTTWPTASPAWEISSSSYETAPDSSLGLKPVAQFDGSGNLVSQFVYGAKGTVPDYVLQGGVTYRVVSDHLGSPRLVVNAATGAVAEQLSFDEFGNITNDSNPGFQPFGFAGGLLDGDTGLTRFGARDFDPRVGRWTAKDPASPELSVGTNPYIYANGDPVNGRDPSGLVPSPVLGPNSQYWKNVSWCVTHTPAGLECERERSELQQALQGLHPGVVCSKG